MAKKKEINWIYVGIAVAALYIVAYGGTHQWFSSSSSSTTTNTNTYNTESLTQITETPSSSCSINIPDNSACVGEEVTSTIKGEANANCMIFYKFGGNDWKYYGSATLGSNGQATVTDSAGTAGEYKWAAICGNCITNFDSIIIFNCDDDSDDSSDGSDDSSDGGPITACSSAWPKPQSQLDCSARTPTCESSKYCKFYGETTTVPAHCGCLTPTTCDDQCRIQGHPAGYCSYTISKNPCGLNSAYTAGNSLCKMQTLIGACCCN